MFGHDESYTTFLLKENTPDSQGLPRFVSGFGCSPPSPHVTREHAGSVARKELCGVMLENEALRFY